MIFLNICSENTDALLGSLVDALSAHTGDESSTVRRLCVRGLVQVCQTLATFLALCVHMMLIHSLW